MAYNELPVAVHNPYDAGQPKRLLGKAAVPTALPWLKA
jgi:hypothetical protein